MLSTPIRTAREAVGLRQADAARRLGVPVETLYRIETGRQNAGREMLVRIADLYGCTIDSLLGRATAPLPCEGEGA